MKAKFHRFRQSFIAALSGLSLCFAVFASIVFVPAAIAADTPEALLQDLYAKQTLSFSGKGPSLLDAPLRERFFTKAMAAKIAKATSDPENVVIDFDLFYDGQDAEISQLKVGGAAVSGTKASVAVTFKNFGKPVKLDYSLIKEGDAWKIADIRGKTWSLAKIVK